MVAEVKQYTARVTRDDRFWLIHVPEIDRFTQARHLREVESMARDLIAVMEEVEPNSFGLDVTIEAPAADRRLPSAGRVSPRTMTL